MTCISTSKPEEPNSVYGAAVLMPQLARTAHWHRSFIPHAPWLNGGLNSCKPRYREQTFVREEQSSGVEQLFLPLCLHVCPCDHADLREQRTSCHLAIELLLHCFLFPGLVDYYVCWKSSCMNGFALVDTFCFLLLARTATF